MPGGVGDLLGQGRDAVECEAAAQGAGTGAQSDPQGAVDVGQAGGSRLAGHAQDGEGIAGAGLGDLAGRDDGALEVVAEVGREGGHQRITVLPSARSWLTASWIACR